MEYVEFYVGDNPLVIDGETVGIMSKLSFLDSVGGEGYTQEKYVTLYFSSNDGTKMQEITTKLTHDMTVPLARLLIEQLLKGPNEISDANTSDVRDTIPAGTKLNSLTIRDHVCYVDFSKEFMNMQADVSSGVVVYSIVNTLCELSDVNKVQFTIDGEQQEIARRYTGILRTLQVRLNEIWIWFRMPVKVEKGDERNKNKSTIGDVLFPCDAGNCDLE